jgi:hypothetical protein
VIVADAGLWGQVDSGYDRHRERMAGEAAEQSRTARDIGPMPSVKDPERRERCRLDFRAFCETYFPEIFSLEWSADHLRVLALVQAAVLGGQLATVAMPRGSGKTSILGEAAPNWATLYGHRRYVAVVGAENDHAKQITEAILVQLETNDRLADDFPEVCYPIRRLEGIRQRAAGQLSEGVSTRIRITDRKIVFPTVKGSPVSGSVIQAGGITGRIRGMKHALADGSSIRPDLVLIDDPQTEESARSPSQIEARGSTVTNAILGLAGVGKSLAGLAAVTVVEPDDLADRMLEGNPPFEEWRGERCKALYEWPTNRGLWDQYGDIYRESVRDGDVSPATRFYEANRAAMDAGAVVAWESRKRPDEISALEHCMRLALTRPRFFAAEYQNEPIRDGVDDETKILKPDELAARVSGVPRGKVPDEAEFVIVSADVQGKALFWMLTAWTKRFDGFIVDYGTEPDQNREYFTLRDMRRTLKRAAPGAGTEGAITAGLDRLVDRMLGSELERHSGGFLPVDRMLVDANWQTETVHAWARASEHSARVLPTRGRFYGASSKPISDRSRKRGDRHGPGWFIPAPGNRRSTREVVFDANFYKSFLWARLMVAKGDPGSLTLPGSAGDARSHRMLAEHMTGEERTRVTASSGRTVDEWKILKGRDNHWLDTAVLGCVGASIAGAGLLEGEERDQPKRRKRVSLREAKAQAGARRRAST